MQEVAQATFMFEHFPEVMGMLWKRMLHENKKNWRRTYKVSVNNIDRCIKCVIYYCIFFFQRFSLTKYIGVNEFFLKITSINIYHLS